MGFDTVNGLAGKNAALDAVMLFAAGPLIYLLFAAGGLILLLGMRGHDRTTNLWMVGQVGAALLLGFLINRVLRLMAIHERPFQTRDVTQLVEHDPGASFPSNHATAALAVALVVGIFVSAWWGALLAVPAVFVAGSRVYVGIHWPSDIIGGALVGLVAVAVIWWTTRRLRQRRRGQEPEPTIAMAAPTPDQTVVLSRIDHDTVALSRVEHETVVIPAISDQTVIMTNSGNLLDQQHLNPTTSPNLRRDAH